MTMNASIPSLPCDDHLIAAAKEHGKCRTFLHINGFLLRDENNQPIAWVKYGHSIRNLKGEFETQKYVYEKFAEKPHFRNLIRVPQVYHFACNRQDDEIGKFIDCYDVPYAVIVMEYISGPTVLKHLEKSSEEERMKVWHRVLLAVQTLFNVSSPSTTTPTPPGPTGGGRIVNMVFGQEYQFEDAPGNFNSVEALQDHINESIGGRIDLVADLTAEHFGLCFCDANQTNFMVGEAEARGEGVGPIYVIDFQHCMWLPAVFLIYCLKKNIRDGIYPYLANNLHLGYYEENYEVLEEFVYINED